MGPNDPMQPVAPPAGGPPPMGGPGTGAPPPPPPGEPGPERHHEDVMNALREIKETLAKVAAKVGA